MMYHDVCVYFMALFWTRGGLEIERSARLKRHMHHTHILSQRHIGIAFVCQQAAFSPVALCFFLAFLHFLLLGWSSFLYIVSFNIEGCINQQWTLSPLAPLTNSTLSLDLLHLLRHCAPHLDGNNLQLRASIICSRSYLLLLRLRRCGPRMLGHLEIRPLRASSRRVSHRYLHQKNHGESKPPWPERRCRNGIQRLGPGHGRVLMIRRWRSR